MKHHFVPVAYLRAFVDPDTPPAHTPYLWIADFGERRLVRRTPGNAAHVTDHNVLIGKNGEPDQSVERMFGEFESDAMPIIRHLSAGDPKLASEDFGALIAFVALQLVRVPMLREGLERFFLSGAGKMATLMVRNRADFEKAVKATSPELTEAERQGVYDFASDPANYTISVHSSRALLDALTLASKVEPVLAAMSWTLVVSDRPVFLTSDNPVAVVNPRAESWNVGHGLKNPNTEVTFPLSPRACYWGTWDALVTWRIEATPDIVRAVNLRTVILAQRHCFAHSKELADHALRIRAAKGAH